MTKLLCALAILLLSSCNHYTITEKPSKTLLISHKGVWKDGVFPANTLKAFDEALRQGFDGFELDVVLTADERFLVIHDDILDNTTNCKGVVAEKTSSTISHCYSQKNSVLPVTALLIEKTKHRDEISFLKEVFEIYLPKAALQKIVIDIKTIDETKTIVALKKAISPTLSKAYGHKIIFIGKTQTLLRNIKQHFPTTLTALEGEWGSEPVVDYATYLHNGSHDFVSLNAELMFGHTKIEKNLFGRKRRNRKYLENYFLQANKANQKTIAWVINDKKNYHYLLSKNVEIILTDLSLNLAKKP